MLCQFKNNITREDTEIVQELRLLPLVLHVPVSVPCLTPDITSGIVQVSITSCGPNLSLPLLNLLVKKKKASRNAQVGILVLVWSEKWSFDLLFCPD